MMIKLSKNKKAMFFQLLSGTVLLTHTSLALAVGGGPVTPIPVPGPLGLMMLGSVALVVARRFTRNK